jgi:hypothetical protein
MARKAGALSVASDTPEWAGVSYKPTMRSESPGGHANNTPWQARRGLLQSQAGFEPATFGL